MDDTGAIYQFIAAQGTPYTLPGPWGRFECLTGFFQLRQDRSQLLASLRATFSDELLAESGAIVRNDKGELELHPSLAQSDSILFALRERVDRRPFDVWAAGTSIGGLLPALGIFRDFRAAPLLAQPYGRLFGASSMPDVAVLLSIGIPAAISEGLDRFSGSQIDSYCQRFGIERCVSDEILGAFCADSSTEVGEQLKCPSLTLVAWSLARLELDQPPQLPAIQAHFIRLSAEMGIPFDFENIWLPTGDDVDHLKFVLENGNFFDVSKAVLASLDDRSTFLVPLPCATQAARPTPQSYPEALQTWESLLRQSASAERLKQAWEYVQALHERDFIAQLMRGAIEAADPRERVRILALIGTTRLAHLQGALLTAQFEKAIREGGARANPTIPEAAFRQFTTLNDRVRALTPEKKSWRRKGK